MEAEFQDVSLLPAKRESWGGVKIGKDKDIGRNKRSHPEMFYQSVTKAIRKDVCCSLHPDVRKSLRMCVWAATSRGVGTWAAVGPNDWHHSWCNSLARVLMAPPRWLTGSADEVFWKAWKNADCVCVCVIKCCTSVGFIPLKGPMASLCSVHLSRLLSKLFHDWLPHFYFVFFVGFFGRSC